MWTVKSKALILFPSQATIIPRKRDDGLWMPPSQLVKHHRRWLCLPATWFTGYLEVFCFKDYNCWEQTMHTVGLSTHKFGRWSKCFVFFVEQVCVAVIHMVTDSHHHPASDLPTCTSIPAARRPHTLNFVTEQIDCSRTIIICSLWLFWHLNAGHPTEPRLGVVNRGWGLWQLNKYKGNKQPNRGLMWGQSAGRWTHHTPAHGRHPLSLCFE